MTCQSASLIYLIECKSCGKRYVGESKMSLHERLGLHRSDIKNKKSTPVAKHFNNGTCNGLDDLSITPLELVPQLHPTDESGLVSIKKYCAKNRKRTVLDEKTQYQGSMWYEQKDRTPSPHSFYYTTL